MARIPYPDIDALEPETRDFMKRIDPMVNVFHMMAHAQTAVRPFMRFGNSLLFKTKLDPVLRELVILRVGQQTGAHYEVHQHRIVARNAGAPEEKIEAALADREAPVFSEVEKLALCCVDEVIAGLRARPETLDALRRHLDDRELCELLLTIGFYQMIAVFLENLEIELEEPGRLDDPLKRAKPAGG